MSPVTAQDQNLIPALRDSKQQQQQQQQQQ